MKKGSEEKKKFSKILPNNQHMPYQTSSTRVDCERKINYDWPNGRLNINLLNYYGNKDTANFFDKIFSYSYLPFIKTPTRTTSHSKTLIDNIFYSKPMSNITTGNISSVIPHMIQFLIQPSSTNAKR